MTLAIPPACDVFARSALLLDFDGTLVDIAAEPRLVKVPPGLREDLRKLHDRLGGRIAIVSGRPLSEIDAFLAPLRLAAAGEHGATLRPRPDGAPIRLELPEVPLAWRHAAAALAKAGVIVEQKPAGLVVHFRMAPAAGPRLYEALKTLVGAAEAFQLMPASAAWEVRPRGADKGTAVAALMRAAPFAGHLPLFIGDDVTDEDGIAAAEALGGRGLRVQNCFGDAAGVRHWLAGLAAA